MFILFHYLFTESSWSQTVQNYTTFYHPIIIMSTTLFETDTKHFEKLEPNANQIGYTCSFVVINCHILKNQEPQKLYVFLTLNWGLHATRTLPGSAKLQIFLSKLNFHTPHTLITQKTKTIDDTNTSPREKMSYVCIV